jgi:hypothetical protein
MWRRLKALLVRLFARRSLTQLSLQFVSMMRGVPRRGFDGPDGPYDLNSRVREPTRRGPTGRSGWAAVDEPEEEESLVVFTRHP